MLGLLQIASLPLAGFFAVWGAIQWIQWFKSGREGDGKNARDNQQ